MYINEVKFGLNYNFHNFIGTIYNSFNNKFKILKFYFEDTPYKL